MDWLEAQLEEDRALAHGAPGPGAPFVAHQQDTLGLTGDRVRLPEHFRGPVAEARVCFLGPHVALDPAEQPPTAGATLAEYLAYYNTDRPERRDPYGHYAAIMDGRPWLAVELVHWPCKKEVALQVLKGPQGAALVDDGLALTWALLTQSPVEVLVLTGNDALQWVLPRLGRRYGKLTGVTRLHGQTLGRFPLPGAPDRVLTVVASFHWSPEMPLFVRKVPGLAGLSPGEAVNGARRMIAEAVERATPSLAGRPY